MTPIKLTPEMQTEFLEQIIKQAKNEIVNLKATDGEFNLNSKIKFQTKSQEPVTVSFVNNSFQKMLLLVFSNDKEIGWHGTVNRIDDKNFEVTNIFVYPQAVSGVSVTPDYKEYCDWQMNLEGDVFNHMRFHGHSHVDMAVSPSPTDNKFQTDMLSQLPEDDFYIFMILNKKRQVYIVLYDLKTNTVYKSYTNDNKSEIQISIEDESSFLGLLSDSKKLVKEAKISRFPSTYISTGCSLTKEKMSANNSTLVCDREETLCLSVSDIQQQLGCSFQLAWDIHQELTDDMRKGLVINKIDEVVDYLWDIYGDYNYEEE